MLAAPGAVITLPGRPAWARDWVSDASASFFINGATPAKDAAPAPAGAELRFVKVRRYSPSLRANSPAASRTDKILELVSITVIFVT